MTFPDFDSGRFSSAHEDTIHSEPDVEEVQRPRRPHVLEMVRGPGPNRTELRRDRVIVGRGPDCDFFVDSVGISRHHLLLTRCGPEYRCEDCDSTNGVFLNGIRVQSAVLREGDQIQISDVVFIYHDGA